MTERYAFVMMIREKYWNGFSGRMRNGQTAHSYVQKGVAPPKEGRLLLFYVTRPVGELAGYAELVERKVGDAEEIWREYGHESVLTSREEFMEFIENHQKVSFIRFGDLHEASNPLPLKNLLKTLDAKRLSRKGFYVNRKTGEALLNAME